MMQRESGYSKSWSNYGYNGGGGQGGYGSMHGPHSRPPHQSSSYRPYGPPMRASPDSFRYGLSSESGPFGNQQDSSYSERLGYQYSQGHQQTSSYEEGAYPQRGHSSHRSQYYSQHGNLSRPQTRASIGPEACSEDQSYPYHENSQQRPYPPQQSPSRPYPYSQHRPQYGPDRRPQYGPQHESFHGPRNRPQHDSFHDSQRPPCYDPQGYGRSDLMGYRPSRGWDYNSPQGQISDRNPYEHGKGGQLPEQNGYPLYGGKMHSEGPGPLDPMVYAPFGKPQPYCREGSKQLHHGPPHPGDSRGPYDQRYPFNRPSFPLVPVGGGQFNRPFRPPRGGMYPDVEHSSSSNGYQYEQSENQKHLYRPYPPPYEGQNRPSYSSVNGSYGYSRYESGRNSGQPPRFYSPPSHQLGPPGWPEPRHGISPRQTSRMNGHRSPRQSPGRFSLPPSHRMPAFGASIPVVESVPASDPSNIYESSAADFLHEEYPKKSSAIQSPSYHRLQDSPQVHSNSRSVEGEHGVSTPGVYSARLIIPSPSQSPNGLGETVDHNGHATSGLGNGEEMKGGFEHTHTPSAAADINRSSASVPLNVPERRRFSESRRRSMSAERMLT